MKIYVIGPARSGKTTTGQMLADAGRPAIDTSQPLIAIWQLFTKHLKDKFGAELSCNVPLHDPERGRPSREVLVALGDALCDYFPGILAFMCGTKADVICGIRRRCELSFIKTSHESKKEPYLVVYVHARSEKQDPRDNFELTPEDADVAIAPKTLEEAAIAAAEIKQRAEEIGHRVP